MSSQVYDLRSATVGRKTSKYVQSQLENLVHFAPLKVIFVPQWKEKAKTRTRFTDTAAAAWTDSMCEMKTKIVKLEHRDAYSVQLYQQPAKHHAAYSKKPARSSSHQKQLTV